MLFREPPVQVLSVSISLVGEPVALEDTANQLFIRAYAGRLHRWLAGYSSETQQKMNIVLLPPIHVWRNKDGGSAVNRQR